jgi:Kef-type K+ transport system membrane component KefB
MTLFESMTTFLFVTAGLYGALVLFGHLTDIGIDHRYFLPLSLIAGALASPTDPTPTLAVKEEYKAEGPVTTTILGIGAFDDALGIINFSIGLAVCAALLGTSGGSALQVLGEPFLQIFFSLLNGAIFGGLLVLAGRRVKDRGVLVVLILGTLFSCYGTAQLFGLDELLSIMVTGAVAANSGAESDRFFISIRDYFEELVFVVFFVIAGSHLELSVLAQSFWVILVFAAARICGKFGGAYTGAVLSGAPPAVRKYSAFGLVPQGGIVVGLALLIKQKPELSPIAELLLNIILGTTVFFEFLGPLMTEYALKSTGETGRN